MIGNSQEISQWLWLQNRNAIFEIKDYGQSEIISMLSSISPLGYFKYFEPLGTGIVNDKEFTHYKIYKGSSEFNTLEMKYLLDGVIQECENLGISTLTQEQIEKMRLR